MLSQEIILAGLGEELLSLIRYRNAIVHGQEMSVSIELVERVQKARQELEQQVQQHMNRSNSNDD